MKTRSTVSEPRQTAEERRDAILDAAIAEFAAYGLHGTSTETIAKRVGISQPYIFRLFGTKKELFIAATGRVYDRITATFQEAAAADPDHALEVMGRSYLALTSRHELLLLLQAFAASSDHDVQKVARDRYAELYHFVARISGADAGSLRTFFAYGMLCTVAAAIDLPLLLDLGKEGRSACDSE
jgi:AcrR family transcriptional regulator